MHEKMSSTEASSSSTGQQYNIVVEISEGFKHLGIFNKRKNVLQNFNLRAYFGELYVLLGPHGCGKSTALNVILGLAKLDQGTVEVCGFKPGTKGSGIPGMRVGYTPQCLGLYEAFTVNETLNYYGGLLGMSREHTLERIAFLEALLKLPAASTYIRFCPEMTKRQISFAIAVLHQPELLILDEPTAGVDPILRKSLWKYLWTISKREGTTIIVTTEQAFEAAKSHRLGIMRNGMIIEEGEPQFLLNKSKARDIEYLYLNIYMTDASTLECHQQVVPSSTSFVVHAGTSLGFIYEKKSTDQRAATQTHYQPEPLSSCREHFYSCLRCISCRNLRSLIFKNILLIIRHYFLTLIFIATPVVLIAIFGVFIGGKPHDIPICVINKDHPTNRTNASSKGDIFVKKMQENNMVISYHEYLKTAVHDVKHEKCFGLVVIGRQFSDVYYQGVKKIYCPTVLDERSLDSHCIHSHLDESSNFMASFISRALITARNTFHDEEFSRRNKTHKREVYKEGDPIHGVKHTPMSIFLLPGFASAVMFHTSAFLTAYHLLYLRNNNLLVRDYIAGVKFIEMSLAYLIVDSILMLFVMCITAPLFFAFHSCCHHGLTYLLAIAFSQLILGLCFGCALGVFLKNGTTLSLINMTLFLFNLLMGGVLSSSWSLSWYIRMIVRYVNPTSLGVENIRSLANGKMLERVRLIYSIAYPQAWGLVCIIIFSIAIITKRSVLRPEN